MPSRRSKFRLTTAQMEASRRLRAMLGLSQDEFAEEAKKGKIILSRATIQRAEGNGGGWIKPRTRLEIVQAFLLSIKKSGLNSESHASALYLVNELRGDGMFVHEHAPSFLPAIELPSIVPLHQVGSRADLELWWKSLNDPPTCMDSVQIEAKRALAEFSQEDLDWMDYDEIERLRSNHEIWGTIEREDLAQADKVLLSFKAWTSTWDSPLHGERQLESLAQDLENLHDRGIFTSIGLALVSCPEIPVETPWPPHDNIVRKWRLIIAFAMQPIECCQVWWQRGLDTDLLVDGMGGEASDSSQTMRGG